jgi:beta-phosphoglucomutase-like phosphatase (HAD superfamily)
MKNSLLTSKIKCIIFNLDELIQSSDVKDVLMSLDLPYCVVSIRPRTSISQLLNTAGLLTFFREDRIFSSSGQLPGSAYGALIFFHAVMSMGFEPAECAIVDKSDIGLDLAMEEDFCVFRMNDGTDSAELENKGVLVFNKFADLSESIDLFNEEVDLEIKRY